MAVKSSKIETIRYWIENEVCFKGRTEDDFIIKFLDASDDDVEKSKERIVNYYTYRNLHPTVMRNRDFLIQTNIDVFNLGPVTADFAQNDLELPVALVVKASRMKHVNNPYDTLGLLILGIETSLMEFSRIRDFGSKLIFDMENAPLSIMMQLTPAFLKQFIYSIHECLPLKVHSVHIINAGLMTRIAINICKTFLPEHIKNLVYVHCGSWESVYEHVPPNCLPVEYGGTFGTVEENNEIIRAALFKWRDYMVDDDQYGFNDDQQ